MLSIFWTKSVEWGPRIQSEACLSRVPPSVGQYVTENVWIKMSPRSLEIALPRLDKYSMFLEMVLSVFLGLKILLKVSEIYCYIKVSIEVSTVVQLTVNLVEQRVLQQSSVHFQSIRFLFAILCTN